jgi:23S rRNA (cytidine1920-2'-O)/16S rRNA (cytidine1409-2'-O)-methyltransferase
MSAEKGRRRLDDVLVARELAPDLRTARGLVMTGQVLVDDRVATKPGTQMRPNAVLRLRRQERSYASRAGAKLARALDVFGIDVKGAVVLDAGASAGGFTDCLLQRGARRVYAVDVGYGQMDGRLMNDPRVVALERTNISGLLPETFGVEPPTLCTVDLSYISLTKAVPILERVLQPGAPLVCLVKPLYEGLAQDDIRDLARLRVVLTDMLRELQRASTRRLAGLTVSPVPGGRGAIEFLVLLDRKEAIDIEAAVDRAMVEAAQVEGLAG